MIHSNALTVNSKWSYSIYTTNIPKFLLKTFMKEPWLKWNTMLVEKLLDFPSHLLHTKPIQQMGGLIFMDQKIIEELREKYIKNPPEGMTAKLVKNMSDSDLLDMHYFLTEDDDFDGEEEGFYIDLF